MRLLYLDWPHLLLRLALGREPDPDEVVVVGGRPWEPGPVLDHSRAAAHLGVRRGQPLGTAHDLVPEGSFLEPPLGAAGLAMEAALEALAALAPAVEGEADPLHPAFGQVFLGIEGLDRLWGQEAAIVERARRLVAGRLPGEPRAGIGGTRFGAQVAAVLGAGAIPAGGPVAEAAFLADLPLALLPAEAETRDRLRVLGLTRMGELAALERPAVIARFGAEGGHLHDLVRGLDGRPLRPRRPVERLSAEVELDPPVGTMEPLRFVLHHVCGTLCEQLVARGAGAAHATLALALDRSASAPGEATRRYEQALPEPAAAPDLLERLLMARLELEPPDAPVERLGLLLGRLAPGASRQLTLFTPQLARAGRLDWQLASLAIRFGPDRVLRAEPGDPDALLAERRFAWRAAFAPDAAAALTGERP